MSTWMSCTGVILPLLLQVRQRNPHELSLSATTGIQGSSLLPGRLVPLPLYIEPPELQVICVGHSPLV